MQEEGPLRRGILGRVSGLPEVWDIDLGRSGTCEIAELGDEHCGPGQGAPGASPPLGLTDQNRLLQVGDLLVVLLGEKRCHCS